MKQIKLFYSYSHHDEEFTVELEKHLSTMKSQQLIDSWHDRKISPGEYWQQEIQENMDNSDIILLLVSHHFLASIPCQEETQRALKLKESNGTVVVPVILSHCMWQGNNDISNLQALPTDGKPINNWEDSNRAWCCVCDGIKPIVERIQNNRPPKIKEEFKMTLLENSIGQSSLDKFFVYPDLTEINGERKQRLENNEIDSGKLKNLGELEHKYILIDGDEQSGKTSLCRTLYMEYFQNGFYPVLIRGQEISRKAPLIKISERNYNCQYDSSMKYWDIKKEKRILLIDDIDENKALPDKLSIFLEDVKNKFEYVIVFVDELSNLSSKSSYKKHFYSFVNFSIKSLGHNKRDELIKKCISHSENNCFDIANKEQTARLDSTTEHINAIIGKNIAPSYPVFVITIFNTVELMTPYDFSLTSYGHCYHAMLTFHLSRAGIHPQKIDSYFNFLTELSYFMFDKNTKSITNTELDDFSKNYEEKFVSNENFISTLLNTNIIKSKDNLYCFQYIYFYYYFVAKYISSHFGEEKIKNQTDELVSTINIKDSANIIIFITHHMNNQDLLNNILLESKSVFKKFEEATLFGEEKDFVKHLCSNLPEVTLPQGDHDVGDSRKKILKKRDRLSHADDAEENDMEEVDQDDIVIEIMKSAKSIEIIGQILKNQYGSLEKERLKELFESGQNVGLRLVRSFIDLMESVDDEFEYFIQSALEKTSKYKELSKEDARKASQRIIAQFSYSIIVGWLHKIAYSLGYKELISIADEVDKKTDTVASNLINLAIHTWYTKELNFKKIKLLNEKFHAYNNEQAMYILRDIVSQHVYMHHINYQEKQKLQSLFKFPVKDQTLIQKQKNIN